MGNKNIEKKKKTKVTLQDADERCSLNCISWIFFPSSNSLGKINK